MSYGDSDFLAMQNGTVRDTAIPRFYVKQFKMNKASEDAGRPVYEPREYVEILTPGTKSNPDRPVQEADKGRWPAQYSAFKNGQAMAFDGMPLSEWTMTDKAQVEHFRQWNVHTVENLAQLTDAQIQNLGHGVRELVTKAKLYLTQAKDNSGISRVVAENTELKNRTAALEQSLRDQAEQIRRMTEGGAASSAGGPSLDDIRSMIAEQMASQVPPKNKGGRPKRVETPEHELPAE